MRHTLGCLLGRVAGRSPLEYLNDDERARQQAVVVELIHAPITTMLALISQFTGAI